MPSINITAELAHALAITPAAQSAIQDIYRRNVAVYFAAEKSSPHRNDPALRRGRAEHEIIARRVLGIFGHGDASEIRRILRAGNRYAFDRLSRSSLPLSLMDLLPPTADKLDTDRWYALLVIAFGCSIVLESPIHRDEPFDDLMSFLQSRISAPPSAPARDDLSIRRAQKALGITAADGVGGLYDALPDDLVPLLDHLCRIAEHERTDLAAYTLDCNISPADMSIIATPEATPGEMIARAAMMLTLRAIHKDRSFALQLARDDKSAQVEILSHDVDKAKQAADNAAGNLSQANLRIQALQDALTRIERENAELRKQIEQHEPDLQELASLREAMFDAANTADAYIPPVKESTRTLPEKIVIIGGHPTWAQVLSETGAAVYPSGTTCPASVISAASEVWFQPQYMPHSDYYAAISIARSNSIPVHYFSSTGVNRCREQLYSPQ